jgi:beta-lactamase class A
MTPILKRFLLKRVPFYSLFLVAGGLLVVFYVFQSCSASREQGTAIVRPADCAAQMDLMRVQGSSLVHPLVMADISEESSLLAPLKQQIQQCINDAKAAQKASEISVYFRRLNDGAWFSLYPNQSYNPASLIKVAFLVTFLKEAEVSPGLLNRKVHFDKRNPASQQNIKDLQLRENQDYSIRMLLEYMIRFSDNDATELLQTRLNHSIFNQVFTELGIPVPDFTKEYFITPVDMSKFFRVLYNGTYLSREGSEFALELLTHSTFNSGILAGISDPGTIVAHKFGERIIGNTAELHEFGIVYAGKDPYLIGIMTSGSNLQSLAEVLQTISRVSYQQYRTYLGS